MVSLAALCVALMLLAVRVVAERRVEEIALARTRGASDFKLAGLLALDAAVVTVPAAAAALTTAVLLVPGRSSALSVAVPVVLVLGAVVALPVMAVREARRTGLGGAVSRPELPATHPSPRRLVAEAATVVLAALVLWLVATRESGAEADLVVSLAPVLAAIAAGLIIFRLLPNLMVTVLPTARRTSGITSFLALTRTARAPAHAVLPAIGMLVAIGVVAFGSTVTTTVDHAAEVSSWDLVGADARVDSEVIRVGTEQITSIPGATEVAQGHIIASQRPKNLDNGRRSSVDVMAVDVAAWQRIAAAAPEPVTPIPQLSAPTASGEVPAVVQGNVSGISIGDRLEVDWLGTVVTVEVVDSVAAIPGGPSGAGLVLPLEAVAEAPLGAPEVVYVGGDVSAAEVASTLGVSEDEVSTRSEVLSSIDRDPVLDTVDTAFRLLSAIAAALAATAAVMGLAVGARTRTYGLSMLRTLGLSTRQSAALTAADVVPTSILSTVVGVGVGIGVGFLTVGAIDVRVLSGTLSGDNDTVVDVSFVALAAAAILAVVLIAVSVAVFFNRRARLGTILRAGEPT